MSELSTLLLNVAILILNALLVYICNKLKKKLPKDVSDTLSEALKGLQEAKDSDPRYADTIHELQELLTQVRMTKEEILNLYKHCECTVQILSNSKEDKK